MTSSIPQLDGVTVLRRCPNLPGCDLLFLRRVEEEISTPSPTVFQHYLCRLPLVPAIRRLQPPSGQFSSEKPHFKQFRALLILMASLMVLPVPFFCLNRHLHPHQYTYGCGVCVPFASGGSVHHALLCSWPWISDRRRLICGSHEGGRSPAFQLSSAGAWRCITAGPIPPPPSLQRRSIPLSLGSITVQGQQGA